MSGWIIDLCIVVAVVSAYFLPVKDGSKRVTGTVIRPERHFGSSGVSSTACAANASGSPSTSASSASVSTSFHFLGGHQPRLLLHLVLLHLDQ